MVLPCTKRSQCFLAHHRNHGDLSLGVGLGEFRVNGGVVKADFRGVGGEVGEVDFVNTCPVNSAQAHGARFAGRIEVTAAKLEIPKFTAGLTDRQDFCVRRRIVHSRNSIRRFGYDLALFDDN